MIYIVSTRIHIKGMSDVMAKFTCKNMSEYIAQCFLAPCDW